MKRASCAAWPPLPASRSFCKRSMRRRRGLANENSTANMARLNTKVATAAITTKRVLAPSWSEKYDARIRDSLSTRDSSSDLNANDAANPENADHCHTRRDGHERLAQRAREQHGQIVRRRDGDDYAQHHRDQSEDPR